MKVRYIRYKKGTEEVFTEEIYTGKIWEKGGNKRVYFSKGYIDLNNNLCVWNTKEKWELGKRYGNYIVILDKEE